MSATRPRPQGIEALWREGQEVRGWARYWAMLYGFVLDQRRADPALERPCMMVRYEDLCDRAEATLEAAFAHVGLAARSRQPRDAMAARLSQPTYYDPGFTAADEAVIAAETAGTRARLGYA